MVQGSWKLVISVTALGFGLQAPGAGQAQATPAGCMNIGTPKPALTFAYEHVESTGARTSRTERWESVTSTGSRVRVTRDGTETLQANRHHISDDVAVLDETTRMNATGGVVDSTTFSPGLILDPMLRACAGKSWNIASATATFHSAQNTASVPVPAGELRIVAIREKITVPAGTFETVHYTRTSQSNDEYWKSVEHGVVVQHIGRLPGYTVTETLQSIR